VLNTAVCNFLCFGKRGTASDRVLTFGNDYDSAGGTSYSEIGAPDACSPHCPGEITNEAFGLSIQAANPAPTNSGHFLAVDGRGELGVATNVQQPDRFRLATRTAAQAAAAPFNIVKNVSDLGIKTSGTCFSNTWCSLTGNTITLSSSAAFADTYYACALSSSSSLNLSLAVNGQTTSTFTIQAYNNSGGGIFSGQGLGINYVCSGN
jgi:hypothetical protein